jgi:predicted choloylglycine hydrolase
MVSKSNRLIQHIFSVFILIFFVSCTSGGEGNESSNESVDSTDQKTENTLVYLADGNLRYLELSGTPYERGFSHGELLKEDIKAVTDSLLEDIEWVSKMDPREFISSFLEETDFVSAMEKWTPDILEEIQGISDGSGVDYDVIFMHQLGDEFFFNSDYVTAHKCSSIGINKSDNHPTFAAQNMDIPPYFHGYQTVMKVTEKNGDEAMILTIPGHVGITGMNSRSVSINCNILIQLDYQQKGLPVSCIVRGVLQQNSAAEAIQFVKEIDHASGQNYLIGGKDDVTNLECSSTEIKEFRPYENSSFTYHTNHPMINNSFSGTYLELLKEHDFPLEEALNSCGRIGSFEERFNESTGDFGIEEIKEVLSSQDHDGLDVVSNIYTYASVIYELSDQPTFHIAVGKPHEVEYIEISFEQ